MFFFPQQPSTLIIIAISPKYKADTDGSPSDSHARHAKYIHKLVRKRTTLKTASISKSLAMFSFNDKCGQKTWRFGLMTVVLSKKSILSFHLFIDYCCSCLRELFFPSGLHTSWFWFALWISVFFVDMNVCKVYIKLDICQKITYTIWRRWLLKNIFLLNYFTIEFFFFNENWLTVSVCQISIDQFPI